MNKLPHNPLDAGQGIFNGIVLSIILIACIWGLLYLGSLLWKGDCP